MRELAENPTQVDAPCLPAAGERRDTSCGKELCIVAWLFSYPPLYVILPSGGGSVTGPGHWSWWQAVRCVWETEPVLCSLRFQFAWIPATACHWILEELSLLGEYFGLRQVQAFLIVWMWPGQFLKQYITGCKLMESVSLLSQQFTSGWHCPNVRTQHSSNNNIFWHYVYIASIVMEEGWCECLRFRHLAWEEMSWPDIHLQNMQLPSWLYISLHQDLSLWSFHIIHSTLSVEHLLLLLDIAGQLRLLSFIAAPYKCDQ